MPNDPTDQSHDEARRASATPPSQVRPEDPDDPALQPETLGIDDTDTALATEDASNPAE